MDILLGLLGAFLGLVWMTAEDVYLASQRQKREKREQ